MMKVAVTSLTITPYQRRYLQSIRDLLFHSVHVHIHLDWLDADQWLETGESLVQLAWLRGRLVGIVALSLPLHDSTWLRIAATADHIDPESVLRPLWSALLPELRALHVQTVGLLAITPWIAHYAPMLDFQYQEEIITLARSSDDMPPPQANRPYIRVAEPHDLTQLAVLDHAAFTPPWQMSYSDMRQAYRMASSCTVATLNERILGFQISTFFFDGAHLARLAVHPTAQGKGIGSALLRDLLERYRRRGITITTVNTQASNNLSRRLYQRFHFQPNGYDLPFWSAQL